MDPLFIKILTSLVTLSYFLYFQNQLQQWIGSIPMSKQTKIDELLGDWATSGDESDKEDETNSGDEFVKVRFYLF